MAIRNIPIVTNQIYHVFNLTQPSLQPFTSVKICKAVLEAIWYYQYLNLPMKLSHFRTMSLSNKDELKNSLLKSPQNVKILCFCIMPNHYHLLLKQIADDGISKYVGNVQNSVTRFVNSKHKQKGHLFIGQFKAVRIESDEQLLHVSRYIHLNPYTGYVIKTFTQLPTYQWSSYREYISSVSGICDQTTILSQFKTKDGYKKFIEDQKDYQRTLANIKRSIIEKI